MPYQPLISLNEVIRQQFDNNLDPSGGGPIILVQSLMGHAAVV
jgi:hypothetical protein